MVIFLVFNYYYFEFNARNLIHRSGDSGNSGKVVCAQVLKENIWWL